MAYLNGKATCFTPSLTIEQSAMQLQEKSVDDITNGDIVVKPDKDFDGLTQVNVSGIYYDDTGEPYTKVMRIKKAFADRYKNCEKLEKLIFVKGAAGVYEIGDFGNCKAVTELIFDEQCDAIWNAENVFNYEAKIKTVKILSIGAECIIEPYVALSDFIYLENLEVFEGWNRSITVYQSPLTAECITELMNRVAFVSDGQYLDLGFDNTGKVPESVIDIALSKGWDVW